MPFVIGVMGVGGLYADDNTKAFREAMAAPAALPELKATSLPCRPRHSGRRNSELLR